MTAKERILRYVAKRRTPATRAEIARRLNIPENTVNARVAEYLDDETFYIAGSKDNRTTVAAY